jgi:hypothetical protein
MKAKIIALFLLSTFSITLGQGVAKAEETNITFTDVSPNHWAYEALQKLVNKYHFKLGYPDGTFKGNKNLTRFEVAALLAQVLDQVQVKNLDLGDTKTLNNLSRDYGKELEEFKNITSAKIQSIEDKQDILEMELDKHAFVLDNLLQSLPFTLSGDLGFRYQLNTKTLGDFTNQVPQTRISLDLESRNLEHLDYGVRLLSGAQNKPGNSWWKLADFFAKVPLNFDRFFVTYKPAKFLDLTIGKFRDPFSNTEIYFDEEINPTGL